MRRIRYQEWIFILKYEAVTKFLDLQASFISFSGYIYSTLRLRRYLIVFFCIKGKSNNSKSIYPTSWFSTHLSKQLQWNKWQHFVNLTKVFSNFPKHIIHSSNSDIPLYYTISYSYFIYGSNCSNFALRYIYSKLTISLFELKIWTLYLFFLH